MSEEMIAVKNVEGVNSAPKGSLEAKEESLSAHSTNVQGGEQSRIISSGQDSAPNVSEGEVESKAGAFFSLALRIGLYALAFLMPLFFLSNTANILELNKQFLLFVFSSLLLIFWLGRVLTQRKLEMQKSLLNIFIALFVLAVLVSALFAKNLYQSMIGSENMIYESLISVACLAIVYFLAANTFKSAKEINILFYVLLASSLLTGIFGLLQLGGKYIFSWSFAQSFGFNTVGSINSLEIFLAAILVMAVVLFIDKSRPLWQLVALAVVSAFLLFMLVALNFANVWWALIVVMAVVVGVGIIKQGRASQTKLILAMVVLAIALLLTLTKVNISEGWLSVPTEVSPSYGSTLSIDKGAISDKPFFGTGPGSFGYNWELYRSSDVNQTIFWNIRFSSGISKIFSMPATLGIVGAALWILVVVFFAIFGAARLFFRKGDNWTMAFAFYVSWLFLAIMQFLYTANLTLEFLFWLAMGACLFLLGSLKKEGGPEEKKMTSLVFRRESPLASVFSFLLVIFLVVVISFFFLGAKFWWADVLFARGVSASVNDGNLEKGYNNIVSAIKFNPYRDNYLVSLSQIALLRVSEELAKPQTKERDEQIQVFIADAVNVSKQATDLNPKNPDAWIQRGTVFRAVLGYVSGAEDWMIDSFLEAARLQPKNPAALSELGRSYFLLSDYTLLTAGDNTEKQNKAIEYLTKAEEQFVKAVEAKGDYSPALYQLALIYDRMGRIDEAINNMERTKIDFPNDIGLAFQLGLLYYKKQNLDSAKVEFERAITLDENYSNARYFLGLIYDKKGDKAAAKAQFEKVAGLNPDNEEVKKIIANLAAGKPALDGIAPPGPAPEQRTEPPIQEKQTEVK